MYQTKGSVPSLRRCASTASGVLPLIQFADDRTGRLSASHGRGSNVDRHFTRGHGSHLTEALAHRTLVAAPPTGSAGCRSIVRNVGRTSAKSFSALGKRLASRRTSSGGLLRAASSPNTPPRYCLLHHPVSLSLQDHLVHIPNVSTHCRTPRFFQLTETDTLCSQAGAVAIGALRPGYRVALAPPITPRRRSGVVRPTNLL